MRTPGPAGRLFALALLTTPFIGSCVQPTNFLGSPKVSGGPDGCRARCTQWGLEFAGMVARGEYSDGCICQVPQKPASTAAAGRVAAVGVVLQMRAREEEERQQQRRHPWGPARPPPPAPAFRR